MFEKIKLWYSMKLWNDHMVKNAVIKKLITAEQYKEITGNKYTK